MFKQLLNQQTHKDPYVDFKYFLLLLLHFNHLQYIQGILYQFTVCVHGSSTHDLSMHEKNALFKL